MKKTVLIYATEKGILQIQCEKKINIKTDKI